MKNRKNSRREFIKQGSIAGAGVVLAIGAVPSVFAGSNHAASVPAILGGSALAKINWPVWPMWNPETDDKRVRLPRVRVPSLSGHRPHCLSGR